jgi:hypothetical protein
MYINGAFHIDEPTSAFLKRCFHGKSLLAVSLLPLTASAILSLVPAGFASRLAHDRDTPSCRATVAILTPGEH